MLSNFGEGIFRLALKFRPDREYGVTGLLEMKDSSMADLDRIDINILRHLQRDGRLTNAELAKAVNVSPATCHRRTQRLFEEGHVTGVRGQVNPASIGLGTLVMVGVVLDRSTPESFAAFEEAVAGMKELLDWPPCRGRFRLSAEDPGPRHVGFQPASRPDADRPSRRPSDPHLLRDERGERKRPVAVLRPVGTSARRETAYAPRTKPGFPGP